MPSLLAAPIPPVVPPTNTKQHRQQQQQQQQQTTANTKKTNTTADASSLVQHKVIPPTVVTPNIASETISTNNKQQHTTVAPPRLQNVLKNHASHQTQKVESSIPPQSTVQPSLNLWTNNNISEHTPGIIHQIIIDRIYYFVLFMFSNTTSSYIFCSNTIDSASYNTILYSNSYTTTTFFSCNTNSYR